MVENAKNFTFWQGIFSSPRLDLFDSAKTKPQSLEEIPYWLYAKALLYFHSGQILEFQNLAVDFASIRHSSSDSELIAACYDLRLAILNRNRLPEKASLIYQRLTNSELYWSGELLLLLGTLHEQNENYEQSLKDFNEAVLYFQKCGDGHREIVAKINSVAVSAHLEPHINRLPIYHSLARRAMRPAYKNYSAAGTCFTIISREYQIVGSLHAAVKYASRAVRILEAEWGSQNFYYAVAHRASVWLDLNRMIEANIDIEVCANAPFADIQALVVVLRAKQNKVKNFTIKESIPPAWLELLDQQPAQTLTPHEESLIEFLAKGERQRDEIMSHLFGDEIAYDSKLNRFHNLMNRVRRKSNSLVRFERNHYKLGDNFNPVNFNSVHHDS